MVMSRILLVYYSRTGITKKVSETISSLIDCDIEEIIDKKDRSGALGYLGAGRDATLKNLTDINLVKSNPLNYDLILIGTPVWAFTMSVAIRTYISQNADKFNKVAFFCTEGGTGHERTFKEMSELCNKQPIATMFLLTKDVLQNKCSESINNFINNFKKFK